MYLGEVISKVTILPDDHKCSCGGDILIGFDMPPTCEKCKKEYVYPSPKIKEFISFLMGCIKK